jgi:hypothetical protein
MIDAYLDESGIHEGASVCVIAGYFAGPGTWRKFEKAWRSVFDDSPMHMEDFHAKDLLKKDGPEYKRLAGNLANVIQGFAAKLHPVTAAVVIEDFFSFSISDRKFMTGATLRNGEITGTGSPNKPYYIPFQHCLKRIGRHAPVGGKAHFFFGLGHTFSGYALSLFEQAKSDSLTMFRDALGDIDFPEAKHTPQLQAADLLVHLAYLYSLDMMRDSSWGKIQPTGLLKSVLAGTLEQADHTYQDGECLRITITEGLIDHVKNIEGRKSQ